MSPSASTTRHPGDIVRVVLGALLLSVSVLAVERDSLTLFETNLFELINELPSALAVVLGPVMQVGNVVAAPVIALLVLVALPGRRRAALDIVIVGFAAWFAAKGVKDLIGRPRPGGLIEEISRGTGSEGLGFVSGHSAVAAAIVTALVPYLPRRWARVAWLVPWTVGFARIYYGAHLPLDIVGGIALGWALGAGFHLLLGAPHRIPTLEEAAGVLRAGGLLPTDLRRIPGTFRGSFPFVANVRDEQVFVKLLDPEVRDRDWLYRGARFLAFRDVRDEAAVLNPAALAHREAAMVLLARSAGVRAPGVKSIEATGDSVWMVLDHVEGVTFDDLAPEDVSDELLVELWRQLATLRRAGLAHRDLVGSNIIVSDDGHPWLVDFAHAVSSARAHAMDNDGAELLVTTAKTVGAQRACAAAVAVLDESALVGLLAELQPLALTAENRETLRGERHLLHELRYELERDVGVEVPSRTAWPLRPSRTGMIAAALGLAGIVALIVVGDPSGILDRLRDLRWRWVGTAVVAAVGVALASAAAIVASVDRRLAVGRTAAAWLVGRLRLLVAGGAAADRVLEDHLETAGVPLGEVLRGRARLMRVGWILWGVALVAAATGAWRADADLESRVHVVWFGLIGAGVWAAHELSTSRLPARTAQPSRRTVSPANRSMLVLSSASVLAAGVVLAVSAVTAVGDGPPVAAVAVSQLVAVAVSRAGRAESGPGVHEAVFAGLLLLFGSPLALAVSAAIVASVVGVLLPAVAGLVAWWVDQRRNPPTSARVGEVPSRSGSGAQEG